MPDPWWRDSLEGRCGRKEVRTLDKQEIKRILAGLSVATLIAGATLSGVACAKRAHGS